MYVYCIESFAHIECYSDCLRRGSHLVEPLWHSVMWYKLLMTSAISCPLWSSVCECHKVECSFTSLVRTECGMFVMCCMSVSAVL